jgi:hypothetical protein
VNIGEIKKLYFEYVAAEGYRPEIDKDGDIKFKKEGRTYFVFAAENDPSFVRIVFPLFWAIENDSERAKALVAADKATAETKVAKVFLTGSNVSAAFEMFCLPSEALQPVLARSLRTLEAATEVFVTEMRK